MVVEFPPLLQFSVNWSPNDLFTCKVKVRQSHYKPGQAQRCSRRLRLQMSGHSAHAGGKVVSPTHRPPLPPGNISGSHFCYRLSQPQGHSATGKIMSMKNISDTIWNLFNCIEVNITFFSIFPNIYWCCE